MKTETIQKQDRQYYIDWLRIVLILSVFLFHIGMIFNSWEWHVKNDVTSGYKSVLWYIMVFFGRWRMPLLILISGAGTYFALGKRSSWEYLGERFKRLFIPLLVGVFTLVPVQVYIEKSAQYDSLLGFYPHMFEGIYPTGNFSWHHLWFIAYLFVIALMISPFLGYLRGEKFARFKEKLERIVTRPLGANIFLIPLVLSQALLRPFFPETTHALLDDWATVSFYSIFFLSGFTMLSSRSMVESVSRQRKLFCIESIVATIMLFTLPYMFSNEFMSDITWQISEAFVGWSCGLTAIGYAKQYLTADNKFRRLANEAIYPFYLIHQPVIVVMGYIIVQWDIAILWKVLLITFSSFIVTVSIYWLLVRPFNVLRVIFGMKRLRKENTNLETSLIFKPVMAEMNMSFTELKSVEVYKDMPYNQQYKLR